ncbi:MAG: hypothetical protein PHE36_04705 [Novosphingobium sp.]|nr:hypothetical protein [Novosphingobium sp.]
MNVRMNKPLGLATAPGSLTLGGFYQFGYVTREMDPALDLLGARYGVKRFQRIRLGEAMETAYAWTGRTMIEVIAAGEGAHPLYYDHVPEEPGILRLHHLGYRIGTREEWNRLQETIVRLGLEVPHKDTFYDGELSFTYVDTRAELGIYSEYVIMTGAAEHVYDEVPQNA